jgi:hypothetical protein
VDSRETDIVAEHKHRRMMSNTRSPNSASARDDCEWKLKCIKLSGKYFEMIKDLKLNLKELKDKSASDIRQAQRTIGT